MARRSKQEGYIGIEEEEEEEEGRKRKREAEIVRGFRVRNRFPRVKPSSLSQRNSLEALLCVRASTLHPLQHVGFSWLSFVVGHAAKRETFAFRYLANLARSWSLSELVHRREGKESTSGHPCSLHAFNLRPSSVEAHQATCPLSFLGCLVAWLAAC